MSRPGGSNRLSLCTAFAEFTGATIRSCADPTPMTADHHWLFTIATGSESHASNHSLHSRFSMPRSRALVCNPQIFNVDRRNQPRSTNS